MTALSQFESGILSWMQENLRGAFDGVALFISQLCDYGWFWIALTLLLLCIRKTRSRALGSAFSLVLAVVSCNLCMKQLVARVRPYQLFDFLVPLGRPEQDTSFPSGHTCSSFAAAMAITCMFGKKAGNPAFVLATLIALSRLYMGMHFPTDVLAGAILGVGCGLAGTAITKAILRKKNENTKSAPND